MERKFQPTLGATIFTLAMFMVLIGLGAWQLKRLEWKTALLAQIESQMQKPPVPLPEKIDYSSEGPSAWEYRRVTMAGAFLYDHEFLIKPRTLDGENGYDMLVPFQRISGSIVMVNRGWISDRLMAKAARPRGLIQIEGIIQRAHPTAFTPANNPQKNDWYWADINAMAKAAKLANVVPVLVNIAGRGPGVYPAGGKVAVNIHNDHLQYAIFWFVMAFVLQVIFVIRHWKP